MTMVLSSYKELYNFETGQILKVHVELTSNLYTRCKNNDMTVALLKIQLLSSNNNRFW